MARQDVHQVLDSRYHLAVLRFDLLAFEPGQLIQTKVKNGISLLLTENIAAIGEARFAANQNPQPFDLLPAKLKREQFDPRFLAVVGSANDADELVEIRQRNQIPLQRFSPLLGFA